MRVEPAAAVVGHLAMPGDKSVSHRAVLVGAIADGEARVEGFGRSADTEATIRAVRALGAEVEEPAEDLLLVRGRGLRGLSPPSEPVDCGNAGTLMRLLPGILAGQEGRFELRGDASLSARPMERVAEPLRRMGASVETTEGHAPLVVEGGRPLTAIDWKLPVASAQVKSAVLLAGLYAERGRTTVLEPAPTRDHTELLLQAAGARVTRRPHSVSVFPAERLALRTVHVPGDVSTAAPFLVAGVLLAGSSVTVHGVGLNPRRTGLLDVLGRMGARISIFNRRRLGVEPVGDVEVHASPLVATTVGPEEVPRLVDELPLLALAAGLARGETVVHGAGELRVKESDRLERVVGGLRGLGVRIVERDDGFAVRGVPARPRGGALDAAGDHRLAMLAAVAGLVSREGVEVGDAECVAISSPGFFELLDSVTTR